jgi:hypothetical protein
MTVSCLRGSGRVFARRDGELGELSGRGTSATPGVLGNALGGGTRCGRGCVYDTVRRLDVFRGGDVEASQVQGAARQVVRGRCYGQMRPYRLSGGRRVAVPRRTDESGKAAEGGCEHQRRYRAETASRTTLERGIHVGPTPENLR